MFHLHDLSLLSGLSVGTQPCHTVSGLRYSLEPTQSCIFHVSSNSSICVTQHCQPSSVTSSKCRLACLDHSYIYFCVLTLRKCFQGSMETFSLGFFFSLNEFESFLYRRSTDGWGFALRASLPFFQWAQEVSPQWCWSLYSITAASSVPSWISSFQTNQPIISQFNFTLGHRKQENKCLTEISQKEFPSPVPKGVLNSLMTRPLQSTCLSTVFFFFEQPGELCFQDLKVCLPSVQSSSTFLLEHSSNGLKTIQVYHGNDPTPWYQFLP